MIKQECIGIPDMILLLMIFCFKKIKIKAEIVLSPGGAYFLYKEKAEKVFESSKKIIKTVLNDSANGSCHCFDFLVSEDSTKRFYRIAFSPTLRLF